MILPQSATATLFVLLVALFCLSSWASTYKLGGSLRFELYYLDFAFGVALAAVLIAFTCGSLGFDGFSLQDDIMHAGKRQWLFATLSGALFNVGNMFIMASVAVSGMAVAFPVGIGMAMVTGTLLTFFGKPSSHAPMLLAGCGLLLASMVSVAFAQRQRSILQHEDLARTGKTKTTRRPSSIKGVLLAVAGGIVTAPGVILADRARESELGLGPYAVGLLFALGAFATTFVLSLFFMNLPVEGEPVEVMEFLHLRLPQHLLGFFGGMIWLTGIVAMLVATGPPAPPPVAPMLASVLLRAAPLVAALWGMLVWREFRGTDMRTQSFVTLMLVLFACGLALLSLANVQTPVS